MRGKAKGIMSKKKMIGIMIGGIKIGGIMIGKIMIGGITISRVTSRVISRVIGGGNE